MKRDITNKINRIIDYWIPPVIRDNKFITKVLFHLVLGQKYKYYMEFKDKLPFLTEEEINQYYDVLQDTFISRDTDLNQACIKKILEEVNEGTVLDAADGRGYMANQINKNNKNVKCTVCDIVIPPLDKRYEDIKYVEASLTKLPFEDNSFDTVICTHALEHIKNVNVALKELRRVCNKKLIIVLPRQREYKYTYDLHINFFPYKYKVELLLGTKAHIELLDNDWMCIES